MGLRLLHPRLLCELGVREHRSHSLATLNPPLLALWGRQVGGILELFELLPCPLFALFFCGGVAHDAARWE